MEVIYLFDKDKHEIYDLQLLNNIFSYVYIWDVFLQNTSPDDLVIIMSKQVDTGIYHKYFTTFVAIGV